MYLKKIEIQGFKSFADKTEIEFKNEITAIVGPNGSGKSNISDAIRWVLGEQSIKNLRGSKMEDVIFSGTEKRRPLGYAEVTITFDNNSGKMPLDYREIAVTRRMFRSGESEYYINKNSCRLKDIRELFMDSGIGKDGYSIIGQGKIDEILSNKPEDRRSIFEEAAGIIKYRSKKEEAERKLEKTDNNIIRIKDLIYEVSNQKDVLEEEAKKATEFTRIYSKLKSLEINLFLRDIKRLEKQINEANIEKTSNTVELENIEIEKNSIEEKYNFLKTNIDCMEKEIEESRTIKFDTIQSFEKNKNQVELLTEKESFIDKDIQRLINEKLEAELNLQKLEESKVDVNEELEKLNTAIVEKRNELDFNNARISEIDKLLLDEEMKLELEKSKIMTEYNQSSDKRSQINSINSFNENIDKRITQLENEIKDNELHLSELLIKIDVLNSNENNIKNEIESEKQEVDKLKMKKISLEEKYNSLNEHIKSHQIKLNGLNASYNLYKNMEAGYEGYYKSVKGLLSGTKNNDFLNKGLVGVVADLLKVEATYEKAIDISLGSSIQNIVVETEEDAKKLVNYLKVNKLGRATFLPINVIKGKTIKIDPKDKDEYGILGLASDLITYDKKYKDIFESLLGRTIIVKDIDYGIRFANKYSHIYRIVTLDGEVLNSGGSITGGSSGKEAFSIINRKNKIQSLKAEIDSINNDIIDIEKNKTSLIKDINHIEINISDKDKSLKSLELRLYDTERVQNNNAYEVKRLNDDINKKISEINTLKKELESFLDSKSNLIYELSEIEKVIEARKIEVEKNTLHINSLKQNRSDLDIVLTDIRLSINNLENSIASIEENVSSYLDRKKLILTSLDEKNKAIVIHEEDLNECSKKKEEFISLINDYEVSEEAISLKLKELMQKKDSFMKTFYDEQERLKVINKRISQMEKHNSNIEIKLAKHQLHYENIHEKLLEDYELTVEDAEKFETEIIDMQLAQDEVKKLKEEIKNLGNVNVSAIDEYKNVTERYDFITLQHSDLIKAKDDLKEVIKDMEKKMRIQFSESFEEINENFSKVFSILFNGGKARLELDEEDDILKSGIEIKVQPPGKRLQNLSLLSGGEKSLTAVAILFAILRTKPAPFCILDEIDAALDEANISRYTNYLKQFNEMTQFVMITHRKTTMEIADILYGVTMEENGVSKLISVKLKENIVEAS